LTNKWVMAGVTVSIVLHLILVYILPHAGINPFRIEPFPAEWWPFIILIALPGFFVIELEELVIEYFKRRSIQA